MVLTAVLLRVHAFCGVTLCQWVSGSDVLRDCGASVLRVKQFLIFFMASLA